MYLYVALVQVAAPHVDGCASRVLDDDQERVVCSRLTVVLYYRLEGVT